MAVQRSGFTAVARKRKSRKPPSRKTLLMGIASCLVMSVVGYFGSSFTMRVKNYGGYVNGVKQTEYVKVNIGDVEYSVPSPANTGSSPAPPSPDPSIAMKAFFMRFDKGFSGFVGYAFTNLTAFENEDVDEDGFRGIMESLLRFLDFADIDNLTMDMSSATGIKDVTATFQGVTVVEHTDDLVVTATRSQVMHEGRTMDSLLHESFFLLKNRLVRLAVLSIFPPGTKPADVGSLEQEWRAAVIAENS